MKLSSRSRIYAGLLLAAMLAGYLIWLWQPERQVRLHTAHLINALEQNDWGDFAEFVSASYVDQWKQDQQFLLARVSQVAVSTPNLRLEVHEWPVTIGAGEATWSARIKVDADPGELTALIKERVNGIETPFQLRWRKESWKPWDWQLVWVGNESLELSTGFY